MTREPGVRSQQRQQPADQRERPDHQRREHRFDAIRTDPAFRVDRAGVVDDDVQAWFGGAGCVATAAPIDVERAHVRDDDREPILAVAGDELVAHARRGAPRLRPTSTTLAPAAASSPAACRPRPDVGPVMSAVRPSSAPAATGAQSNRARRARYPIDEKLPTTVISSRSSMSARGSTRASFRSSGPDDPSMSPRPANPCMDHMHLETRMTTLRERIETPLPIDETFAYVADFANSQEWDPGVATAERLDPGPVGVGSRYRLGVRMGGRVAPMEYRISVFEPPTRVVLTGEGSGVTAVDDIRFEPAGDGTRVDYTADIKLGGFLGLIQPLLGRRVRQPGPERRRRHAADARRARRGRRPGADRP